jgi:hypothetical protein
MLLEAYTVLGLWACTAWSRTAFQVFHSSNFTPPELQVNKSGAALADGYLFITPTLFTLDQAPLIMSDSGELIWNGPLESSTNFLVQTLKGQSVLTWWTGIASNLGRGYGQVNIVDQTYTQIYTVCPDIQVLTTSGMSSGCSLDLHESLITETGTMLCTLVNVTRADLTSLGGPVDGWVLDTLFLEVDIATNDILFMWSPTQAGIPINSTKSQRSPISGTGTAQSSPFDWFHANSVSKLQDGSYIVNSRNTWSTYCVGSDGKVKWTLEGSTGGDFAPLPDGADFVSDSTPYIKDS